MVFQRPALEVTAADLTGHAHPPHQYPMTTSPKPDDPWDLVQRMRLEVRLQGLLGDDRPSPASMVLPRVRRSSINRDKVQHLDIVSCWKGISPSQANELATWEAIFEECLASHISKHLQEGCVKWLNQYMDSSNEALLVSRFEKYLEFGHTSPAEISIMSLVEDMVSHLYEQPYSQALHRYLPWTLSSGHMPSLVYNFVRTRDCFLHTEESSHVNFTFGYQYRYGIMHIDMKLLWNLPKMEFPNLRTDLQSGETYRVTPRLHETSLGTAALSEFDVYRDDVSYSISSPAVSLRWESRDSCFHALVRQGDENSTDSIVKSVLTATIVTKFHVGVRFERVSRYVIQAKIHANTKPVPSPHGSGATSDTQVRVSALHKDKSTPLSRSPTSTQLLSSTVRLLHQETGTAWVPSYSNTPISKKGRRDSMEPLWDELSRLKNCTTDASTSLSNIEAFGESDQLIQEVASLGMRLEDLRHRALEEHDASLMRMNMSLARAEHYNPPPSSPASIQVDSDWDTDNRYAMSKDHHTPPLPMKRKASGSLLAAMENPGQFALDKFEHLELEVDAKRRKLQRLDHRGDMDASKDDQPCSVVDGSDDALHALLTNITTGPMGVAQTSPTRGDGGFWSATLDRRYRATAPRPHAATLAGIKHTKFPWNDSQVKCPACPPSDSSSSQVHEVTPPGSALSEHPVRHKSKVVLTQEQIQQNYQEFEERAKQKAAEKAYYASTVPGFDGIVSPTDENDKSFERIFLEDGETNDWESDMDVLSEEMESVCFEY